MNRKENLIRWYRERILDLTLRIEEAILKGLADEYLEELEEMRSRFELSLDELLNSDEADEPDES